MTLLEFTPRHVEFFVFSFKTARWIISLDRFRSPCDYLTELPIKQEKENLGKTEEITIYKDSKC